MDANASQPRLRDVFRAVIRVRGYSRRTEKSYWYWTRYFIRFHGLRHARALGAKEVRQFLSFLAVERNVAASTRNQAMNAIVFLYTRVLEQPLGNFADPVRAKRPKRIPVALAHSEAMGIIEALEGPYRLMAALMYGGGLHVIETARLRVKDIDLSRRIITVRDGKDKRDRTTLLPEPLEESLSGRMGSMRRSWQSEGDANRIPVTLPFALARKYSNADTSFHWLFPSSNLCRGHEGACYVITFM